MRATGFTKEFDAKVVRDSFLGNTEESVQKAVSPEEILRIAEFLEKSDKVFAITLAIRVGDEYVPYIMRSDGEWIWPGHLGELVRSRDIDLNEDFLEHVRSRQYRVRPLSKDEIRKIEFFIVKGLLR